MKKMMFFSFLRAEIIFCKKMCFWAKSGGQIVFLLLTILDFLCLDPSILIKIAILDHFFLRIARKNTLSKSLFKLRKTIIFPLDYEKKCHFVHFLIKNCYFLRKVLSFFANIWKWREQIVFCRSFWKFILMTILFI